VADHDHERVAALLETYALEAWYGFAPDALGRLIDRIDRAEVPLPPFLTTLKALLGGVALPEVELPAEGAEAADTPQLFAGRLLALRLHGPAVEAFAMTRELEAYRAHAAQPLIDQSRGWNLFVAVQTGITAMLAGQFEAALAAFTAARMLPPNPALMFLTRDAYVKAAIIEALYGELSRAESLLRTAETFARTESWAEATVDASAAIAQAIIDGDRPVEALADLDAVPLHQVGEMWPFYLTAVQRVLLLIGDLSEARRRLKLYDQLPLLRVDGQGFNGSALAITATSRAVMAGDVVEARTQVAKADPELPITQILTALTELISSRPRDALKRARKLRGRLGGFRFLELWRLAIEAGGALSLGLESDLREAVQAALRSPGGLNLRETHYFAPEVREFAKAHFDEWPRDPESDVRPFSVFPTQNFVLTERERELLAALSEGHSRDEIAAAQFISVNTLKTHLRSIYRKLGVSSRAAAVAEAQRLGFV